MNKTNFHMKGFALGFALKQRRNATWKLPITSLCFRLHLIKSLKIRTKNTNHKEE